MTIGQFGGDLHNTLCSPGTRVLYDQRPPSPNRVAHILIVDDIAQIVEMDAEVFLAGTSNRKPDLDIFL
jgi:hypothetical protein